LWPPLDSRNGGHGPPYPAWAKGKVIAETLHWLDGKPGSPLQYDSRPAPKPIISFHSSMNEF